MITILDMGSLDRRPRGPVREFFLPAVVRMRGKSVIEGLAIDFLGVAWQMILDRERKVSFE